MYVCIYYNCDLPHCCKIPLVNEPSEAAAEDDILAAVLRNVYHILIYMYVYM